MATIALGATGAYFGGPLGYAAGAALGAFIDSKFLFKQDVQNDSSIFVPEGPRLQGLQIQSGSEGTPIFFIQGPENRLAGQIIWMSDLIEDSSVSFHWVTDARQTSKGSRSSSYYDKQTTYAYFLDIAIALGEGVLEGIDKAFANGKVIFENPELVNFTSNLISAEIHSIGSNKWIKIVSPIIGPDLTNFKTGALVTMSGWATSTLNDSFTIMSTETDPMSTDTWLILQHANNLQATELAGQSVTLNQDAALFGLDEIGDVRFYPGDLVQTPDPLIEADQGIGNVPAFRGISYVVLEKLALVSYGNQMPQMSFLIREATTRTSGEAISNILIRAGLTADQFDVTEATDVLRGFSIRGPQSTESLIIPLMRAFNLVITNRNGKLIFRKRGNQACVTIKTEDLGAREQGSSAVRGFEITDTFGADLPAEINIGFIEPKIDFQESMARERRTDALNNTVVSFKLPIVMTMTDARAIARRILWNAHINSRVISFSLPSSYIDIEENDIVEFIFDDELYAVLVKKIDRGDNTLIRIEGVVEFVNSNTQIGQEDPFSPVDATRGIFIGGTFAFEIIDIAPFTDDNSAVPGIYLAVALVDVNAPFESAQILKSLDGQSFFGQGFILSESTMGSVPALTPDGPVGYFDHGTVITVVMLQGTLESVTELEMLDGANRAVLGNEVLAFQNAVLVDTNTYEISKLIRGLRNTEDQTVGHVVTNERFVMLDRNNTNFTPVDLSDIGEDRSYKAVPRGVPSGQIPGFPLSPVEANSIGTFSPDHVKAVRNGANDLTVTWIRRTRALFNPSIAKVVPLLENRELYQIDIYNLAFTIVLRVITVEGPWTTPRHPDMTYTAAQQTEDGLAPGADVNMVIFQMSEIKGRGNGKVVTI